jgi:hypothetical protein
VTDGQTLKIRLPNFQMGPGSAHANVYGAIDRAISRAKGVTVVLENTERR